MIGTGRLVMIDVHGKSLRRSQTCLRPICAIIFIRKTMGFGKELFAKIAGSGFDSGCWSWFQGEKPMVFRRIATWTKKHVLRRLRKGTQPKGTGKEMMGVCISGLSDYGASMHETKNEERRNKLRKPREVPNITSRFARPPTM